jgi:hypothetical protein
MRDMFDDFLDELRRRQAEQRRKSGEPGAEGESDPNRDGRPGGRSAHRPRAQGGNAGEFKRNDSDNGADRGDEDEGIFRGGGYRGPRRPRSVGSDGDMPEIHIGRGWVIFGISPGRVLILFSLFFSVGVGMWTDAIWYQSVGFANVFWTQVGSQVGLFALGALAVRVLVVNLWLPGRLIPKGEMRRFSLDDFLDRFNVDRYSGGYGNGPFGAPRRPGSGQPTSRSPTSPALSSGPSSG